MNCEENNVTSLYHIKKHIPDYLQFNRSYPQNSHKKNGVKEKGKDIISHVMSVHNITYLHWSHLGVGQHVSSENPS